MRRRWFVLVACALLAGGACGRSPNDPSRSLAGPWVAPGFGHTGQRFLLRLEQSGSTISGTACGVDGGIVFFRDAPVHGRYPLVSFVVAPQSSDGVQLGVASFSGRQDGTGDIVGSYSFGGPVGIDLRFTRGGTGTC
jgi:hypothetical protein